MEGMRAKRMWGGGRTLCTQKGTDGYVRTEGEGGGGGGSEVTGV